MANFDSLEQQFGRLFDSLASKVGSADALSADGVKQLMSDVQNGLDEAEGLVRGMDLEARTGDPALRPQLLARLREHKIRLLALKKDFRRKAGAGAGPRQGPHALSSVLDAESAAAGEESGISGVSQRDRLLSSTARMGATTDRLSDTRQMALQAEELGVHILKDLHDQRQSLLHSHAMLHDVDEEIGRARYVLRGMAAKMNRNKWTVGFILFLLFAAIAIVIFLKLRR